MISEHDMSLDYCTSTITPSSFKFSSFEQQHRSHPSNSSAAPEVPPLEARKVTPVDTRNNIIDEYVMITSSPELMGNDTELNATVVLPKSKSEFDAMV